MNIFIICQAVSRSVSYLYFLYFNAQAMAVDDSKCIVLPTAEVIALFPQYIRVSIAVTLCIA